MRPRPVLPRRRRVFFLCLLAVVAALLAVTGTAFADALTPENGGSPNADDIDSLYKLVLVVAVIVFVFVEGALLYAMIKFRARPGRVAAQIRGNTNLEIGWTVGAAVILIVLTVVTFIKLPAIKNPARGDAAGSASSDGLLYASTDQPSPPKGGRSLNVDVNGQQYIWRFTYPNNAFAYEEMVVPTGTTVILEIRSQDLQHSWWIPKLGGKMDALPGYVNKTWFKIPPGQEGTIYPGQCAELCGRGHANMLARVRALSPAEFDTWLSKQKDDIDAANDEAAKQRGAQAPAE